MIRVDYDGMTICLNGVKEDMECSEYWREADRVMEALRDRLHALASEEDMEIQEIGTNYFMVEEENHLEILEENLEGLLEELAEEIEEEYEEEEDEEEDEE